MKSKIVKQFGAMLLAGTMIVTSGNVTTYAAEQTDESQEVDVNTENDIEESNEEISLRPLTLDDYVGQSELKNNSGFLIKFSVFSFKILLKIEKFMLEKVDTLHLGLEMPEKPPYVLK